jgi:hypothetical protein
VAIVDMTTAADAAVTAAVTAAATAAALPVPIARRSVLTGRIVRNARQDRKGRKGQPRSRMPAQPPSARNAIFD